MTFSKHFEISLLHHILFGFQPVIQQIIKLNHTESCPYLVISEAYVIAAQHLRT